MGVDGRGRQDEQKLQEASAPQCPTPCPPCPAPCPPCPTPCPPCPAPSYPAPSLPGKPGIPMQDASERSIKNGGHRGAKNRDASQEDLDTRAELEATLCRRSSLEESPSTPPPPPPPSSGAPVWERRPRVKTQLQFSFYIQTKLKIEKQRTHFVFCEKTLFCSQRHNKLSLLFQELELEIFAVPLSASSTSKCPLLSRSCPSSLHRWMNIFSLHQNMIPQIFPPTAQTNSCFLGQICPTSVPLLLHSSQGLQPQVNQRPMNANDNGGEKLRLLPCPVLYSIYRCSAI